MAWPQSRLTTYAPGQKVKSNDLNSIQDAVIKLNTKTITIPGIDFKSTDTRFGVATAPAAGTTVPGLKYNLTGVDSGEVSNLAVAATYELVAGVPMPTNATLLNVRFYLRDHATGPHKWECHVYRAAIYDGGATQPIAFQLSAGSGANQTITFTGLNISTSGGGIKAYLRALLTGAGTQVCRIYGAEADIYIP
jgi:hypothetical protein